MGTNKLVRYAVLAEKELTDASIKKSIQILYTSSCSNHQSMKTSKRSIGKSAKVLDFGQAKILQARGIRIGWQEVKFDSASLDVQTKKAALEANGISMLSPLNHQPILSYYIVKLTVSLKNQQTGKTETTGILTKALLPKLQAANIRVKDQAFQNLFSQYVKSDSKSSSSS